MEHAEEAFVYALGRWCGILHAVSSKAITKYWSDLEAETQCDMSKTCLI